MQTLTPAQPIPLTVVGGFLGSGKTTLINYLLTTVEGLRLTVIVNDFGDLDIDAALIAHRDAETIALSNGCVCCTLGGNLAATLMKVRGQEAPPDHLLIEASGVSDPAKIAQIGRAGGAFCLSAIIVLADASEVRDHAGDRYVGRMVERQLAKADLIILNKCDLAAPAEREAVTKWLSAQSEGAPVLETTEARVSPGLLIDLQVAPRAGEATALAESDETPHGIARWSLVTEAPLERDAFMRLVRALPKGLLRAKGFVTFSDSGAPELFQLTGRSRSFSPASEIDCPGARLVFLGRADAETRFAMQAALDEFDATGSFESDPGSKNLGMVGQTDAVLRMEAGTE